MNGDQQRTLVRRKRELELAEARGRDRDRHNERRKKLKVVACVLVMMAACERLSEAATARQKAENQYIRQALYYRCCDAALTSLVHFMPKPVLNSHSYSHSPNHL